MKVLDHETRTPTENAHPQNPKHPTKSKKKAPEPEPQPQLEKRHRARVRLARTRSPDGVRRHATSPPKREPAPPGDATATRRGPTRTRGAVPGDDARARPAARSGRAPRRGVTFGERRRGGSSPKRLRRGGQGGQGGAASSGRKRRKRRARPTHRTHSTHNVAATLPALGVANEVIAVGERVCVS